MKLNVLKTLGIMLLCGSSNYVIAANDGIYKNTDDECALYLCVPGGFISDSCTGPRRSFHQRLTAIDHKGRLLYTPLPRFDICENKDKNNNSDRVALQNAYNKAGIEMPADLKTASNVGYVSRPDAHIPTHQECTGWTTAYVCERNGREYSTRSAAEEACCDNRGGNGYCSTSRVRKITYCSSWKTVPEHYVEGTYCQFNYGPNESYMNYYNKSDTFKYDDKNQIVGSYNQPQWCDKTSHTVGVTVNGQLYGDYARSE